MNLSKRQLFIIVAVVVVLLVLVLILLSFNKSDVEPSETKEPQIYDSSRVSDQAKMIASQAVDPELNSVGIVARNFIERYLSFSNQNWGENVQILQSLMTEGMLQRSQQDLIKWKAQHLIEEFYGVSTKLISQKVLIATKDSYVLEITVQQSETIGDSSQVVYNKYEVELNKITDGWLVDSLILSD